MALSSLRVLVIADNLLIRTGLAAVLTAQTDLEIVGQVAGSETLADDLEVYRPEAVIYDLGYEPLNALGRLEALAGLPLIVLLPSPDEAAAVIGAIDENTVYGLLLRDTPPAVMTVALNAVYHGLVTLDPLLAGTLVVGSESPSGETLLEPLTPRELQVLQLLAEGLPNKIIAQRLAISPNTVKFHINAILSKLGVQSRTEAVIRATRLGLVIL